jgi:hypothetical protein
LFYFFLSFFRWFFLSFFREEGGCKNVARQRVGR